MQPSRVISVKLSVTETDIVLVEQLTRKDSSAVILKVGRWREGMSGEWEDGGR